MASFFNGLIGEDAMNDFYREMLMETSSEVKEKMKTVGITFAKG